MSKAQIYHNPRCSKSRQTLAIVEESGIDFDVIEYLKEPPTAETLAGIIEMLGIKAHDLLRRKEAAYSELDLASKKDDSDALIQAMVDNPILIERPIVVVGKNARIGRPPEDVREIL